MEQLDRIKRKLDEEIRIRKYNRSILEYHIARLKREMDYWGAFLEEFYGAIDESNLEKAATAFDPLGVIIFGNNPTVVGPEGFEKMASSIVEPLKSISHDIKTYGFANDRLYCEGTAIFHRKDDKKIVLDFSATFEFGEYEDDKSYPPITRYQVYIDVSPLSI